jgi:hypothetical protein
MEEHIMIIAIGIIATLVMSAGNAAMEKVLIPAKDIESFLNGKLQLVGLAHIVGADGHEYVRMDDILLTTEEVEAWKTMTTDERLRVQNIGLHRARQLREMTDNPEEEKSA